MPKIQIPLSVIVILIGGHLLLALHTGVSMRRLGRRWWVWFLISACLTPIPAAVVSHMDYQRQLRRRATETPPERCRHCGADVEETARRVGGKRICSGCGMALEDESLA